MRTILFICEHNSARSQMAEAFLNHYAGGKLFAESAGLEPGSLNPYAVEVLREEGIDISANKRPRESSSYTAAKTVRCGNHSLLAEDERQMSRLSRPDQTS